MIVVEGPDGGGKTTLVNNIMRKFDVSLGTRGTINRDLLYTVTRPDTLRALSHMVQLNRKPMVWDRLYYSDFVYAPLAIPSRETAFDDPTARHIDAVIEAVKPPIIVCLPPWEVVEANILSDRHQMEGVVEKARAIYDAYTGDDLFPEWTLWYDYTTDDPDLPINYIATYLRERAERT